MKHCIRLYFIIQLVFHFGLGNTCERGGDYKRGWESRPNVPADIRGIPEYIKHTNTET